MPVSLRMARLNPVATGIPQRAPIACTRMCRSPRIGEILAHPGEALLGMQTLSQPRARLVSPHYGFVHFQGFWLKFCRG